jgi:hypothetical protein
MRALTSLRLLLVPAIVLAAACDDSSSPLAPEEPALAAAEAPVPQQTSGPLEDYSYWADGYLWASHIFGPIAPIANSIYNRYGGPVTVTQVAGTTGRYIARFSNLSALLEGKSTMHVTAIGVNNGANYCKPVGGFLVRDSVEVRCFKIATGAAVNTDFALNVLGKREDRAFAFANQPTANNYAPGSAGSWNPAGPTRIYRDGVGRYRVVYSGLGGWAGHAQVNAVGTTKAHCLVDHWSAATDLEVTVACFTPAGVRTDTKFTTFFTRPAAHLAYVWANQPTVTTYNPDASYSSNPVGGAVTITRLGVGSWVARWTGIDAEIRDYGNTQVTAWGYNTAQCKTGNVTAEAVTVKCYGVNGAAIDTQFLLLLGS